MKVCDRCRKQGQLTLMVGRDICNPCLAAFSEWVDAGVPMPPVDPLEGRMPRAGFADAIRRLLHAHGGVTPDMLAAATGTTRRRAHGALRDHKRAGRLVQAGFGEPFTRPEKVEVSE